MKQRIQPLDGLRTLAAFGVIWIHIWGFYANPSLKISVIDIYQLVAIAGNGVDFFFVISGFCMYLMIANKKFTINTYLKFILKRLLRIAPAFYISVLVYALIIKTTNPSFLFWYNVIFHFLFLNNIVTGNTISGPLWSIGTEWHFYILLPIFVLIANKYSLIKTVVSFSFISLILFCVVNLGYLSYGWWESQIVIRFPEFGAGIIAAYFFLKNQKMPFIFSGLKGLFLGLIIMYAGRFMKFTAFLVYVNNGAFLFKALADTIMTIGFSLILYNVITQVSIVSKFLSARIMTYLGRISFSIYLWHSLCIYLLNDCLRNLPFGNFNPLPGFLLVSLLTIGIAHFSYIFFESFYFKIQVK